MRSRAPVVGGVNRRGWRARQGAKGENPLPVLRLLLWSRRVVDNWHLFLGHSSSLERDEIGLKQAAAGSVHLSRLRERSARAGRSEASSRAPGDGSLLRGSVPLGRNPLPNPPRERGRERTPLSRHLFWGREPASSVMQQENGVGPPDAVNTGGPVPLITMLARKGGFAGLREATFPL